jgi:hypothetical protein
MLRHNEDGEHDLLIVDYAVEMASIADILEKRFRQGSRRFAWPAEIGLRYRFSSSRGDGGCGV